MLLKQRKVDDTFKWFRLLLDIALYSSRVPQQAGSILRRGLLNYLHDTQQSLVHSRCLARNSSIGPCWVNDEYSGHI